VRWCPDVDFLAIFLRPVFSASRVQDISSCRHAVISVNCGLVPPKKTFLKAYIWHTFCWSATKFDIVRGLANRNLFLEFRELWFGGPAISRDDMHQSNSLMHLFILCVPFLLLHGRPICTRRHVVYCFVCFVGHAINEIDDLWQQISRRGIVRTGRNLSDC